MIIGKQQENRQCVVKSVRLSEDDATQVATQSGHLRADRDRQALVPEELASQGGRGKARAFSGEDEEDFGMARGEIVAPVAGRPIQAHARLGGRPQIDLEGRGRIERHAHQLQRDELGQ